MSPAEALARGLGAAGLAVAVFGASLVGACRLLPDAHASVRACAAALIAAGALTGAFWLLSPWHLFRLGPALLLAGAGAAVAWAADRRDGRAAALLARDLRRLRRIGVAFLRTPAGWVVAAVIVAALVRLVLAAAAPPLGWDGLTYHLFKAGRFVQDGGSLPMAAPDGWGDYELLAPGGEILWAWAMLPLSADALVPLAEAAIWALLPLAVYALGRDLGARRAAAALAAACLGAVPASLALVGSGYVDNAAAAFALLGAVFLLRCLSPRPPRPVELVLVAIGAGLAVGVKVLALPVVVVVLAGLAVALFHRDLSRRHLVAAACAAALALGAPAYVGAWARTGSPVYPLPVEVAGHVLFAGRDLAAGAQRITAAGAGDLAAWMLWRRMKEGAFLDPGFAAPLLALAAVVALPALLRSRRRWGTLVLVAVVAAELVLFASGPMRALIRTSAVATTGRYFLAGLGALAALAAAGPRWARPLLGLAALLAVWQGWPRSWDAVEALPVALIAALGLAAAGAVVVAARFGSRPAQAGAIAGAASAVGGVELPWP